MSADETVARVSQLFDLVSDTYDNVGVDFFQVIASSLLEELPPVPGEDWLDVGCGRGAVLFRAADAIGPKGSIVGVDVSPQMIERTSKDAAERGLTNATFALGDAQDLPVQSASFDTVSSCLVLFFVPDPVATLTSMRRAVRSGGRVGITTFGPADPSWEGVDSVLRPHMPQPRPGVTVNPAESPFASDAGVEGLFKAAGFADVRSINTTLPIRFPSIEKWLEFSWSHAQRAMWLGMPEQERPDLRAALTAELQKIAAPDGSVPYAQKVRHTVALEV